MNTYKWTLYIVLAFACVFSLPVMAFNHVSETGRPIIAQTFIISTVHDQKWEDKFRPDTPFTKLNRLYLGFGKIVKRSDHHHWVKFDGDDQRALDVIKRMKEVNPHAEIFLVLDGDANPNSFGGAAHDDKFAGNVLAFLQQYGLDGLDIHWLNDLDKDKVSMLLTNLYNTLHVAGYKLTLDAWQYVSPGYNIPYIKDYVDQINVMSFGTGISLAVCVNDYVRAGFPSRKIIGGIETETGYNAFGGITDTLGMRGTIEQKANFAKGAIAGMMGWRLDNDYASKSTPNYPTYKGAIALWEEMN